jgi:hypothetical protein
MSSGSEKPDWDAEVELNYLKRRVYEEARAAVAAPSTGATLAHVILATAYAKRLGEQSRSPEADIGNSWADQNRIW